MRISLQIKGDTYVYSRSGLFEQAQMICRSCDAADRIPHLKNETSPLTMLSMAVLALGRKP